MELRPFNLEYAKKGCPLITRDGRKVKFIAHVPEATPGHQVLVLTEEQKTVLAFYSDGKEVFQGISNRDLFMAPLCQVEGKDVFPGDELWNKSTKVKLRVLNFFTDKKDILYAEYESGRLSCTPHIANLTWVSPFEKKTHTKHVLLYKDGSISNPFNDKSLAEKYLGPDIVKVHTITWESEA